MGGLLAALTPRAWREWNFWARATYVLVFGGLSVGVWWIAHVVARLLWR